MSKAYGWARVGSAESVGRGSLDHRGRGSFATWTPQAILVTAKSLCEWRACHGPRSCFLSPQAPQRCSLSTPQVPEPRGPAWGEGNRQVQTGQVPGLYMPDDRAFPEWLMGKGSVALSAPT